MTRGRPSLDHLLTKVDSKYTLVVATAKRGRQLMDGAEPMVESTSNKPVSISLQELADGYLFYERTTGGIK